MIHDLIIILLLQHLLERAGEIRNVPRRRRPLLCHMGTSFYFNSSDVYDIKSVA